MPLNNQKKKKYFKKSKEEKMKANENAINRRLGLKSVKATIVEKPLMKSRLVHNTGNKKFIIKSRYSTAVSKPSSKPKFIIKSKYSTAVSKPIKFKIDSKQLDIDADLKDNYGKDIKTSKVHKAGKCVFPFKVKKVWPEKSYTGKMLGEEVSGKMREILDQWFHNN